MVIVTTQIPAATGAGTVYVPVPADMTVLGFSACPSTATGGTSTVTVSSGSTALGTAAIGAADAAGVITNATMHATLATRKTKVTKAIPVKVAVDARSNSSSIFVSLWLDEFALQRD
jgi:hypothetical protein